MMRTRLAGILIATFVAGVPLDTLAQEGTLDRYRPSETTEDDFHLSRPTDFGDMRFGAQLQLDYGLNPLVYEAMLGDRASEAFSVVQHHLVGTLGLAFGVKDRLVLYGGLPVSLVMKGDSSDGMGLFANAPEASGAGLGDIYLGARVRIIGDDDDVGALGLQVTGTFPTANASYRGEDFLTLHPELLGELRPADKLRIVLNVGAMVRRTSEVESSNLRFGSELTYGLGLGVPVWESEESSDTHLDIHGQIYGASSFAQFVEREGTALEATLGLKYFNQNGLVLGLAGGPGLTRGFGSPDLRLIGSIGWAMPEGEAVVDNDPDNDGVVGDQDQCPQVAEDRDSFEDDDGCIDPDNDSDGILDTVDECPNRPETINDIDDEDGCPDAISDRDGDGLADDDDSCPDDPEDVDGYQDEDGCPDLDHDGDGVLDTEDRCPSEPGEAQYDGCPPPDRDGDTVADPVDNCPDEAGLVEHQGCQAPQQVQVTSNGIEIMDQVYFRTNRAVIRRQSFPLLMNVAQVLNNHPEIDKILVEGHTDARGSRRGNLRLSQDRAEAVVNFLVRRGQVDRSRLEAHGYGPDRHLVENASTPEEHARNRRVEFNIPEGSGIQQETDGPTADTIDH